MSPITNMLVQIKNAQAVGKERIVLPFSKTKFNIAKVLKESGFIKDVEKRKKKIKKFERDYLDLFLKYNKEDEGVIKGIKIISKPSRRLYVGADEIKSVRSGFGIAVLSTNKGIMSSKTARKENLGGEMLFEIW